MVTIMLMIDDEQQNHGDDILKPDVDEDYDCHDDDYDSGDWWWCDDDGDDDDEEEEEEEGNLYGSCLSFEHTENWERKKSVRLPKWKTA